MYVYNVYYCDYYCYYLPAASFMRSTHMGSSSRLTPLAFGNGNITCYAMLCYAMLCYAMLCYAMRDYNILYNTILLQAVITSKATLSGPDLGKAV